VYSHYPLFPPSPSPLSPLSSDFPSLELKIHDDYRDRAAPSVAAQIRLFQGARVAIGAHGAGLANCIWMGPGSDVIEFSLAPVQPTSYAVLSAALGLRYWVVPAIAATQLAHYHITPEGVISAGETLRAALTRG